MNSLSFSELSCANKLRQREWDTQNNVTTEYRGNETAGEIGETLEIGMLFLLLGVSGGRLSNIVKKLARERNGMVGSRATPEELGNELADVVICCSLLANEYQLNLGECIRKKFNITSEKNNLNTRL